jgi:hypothetical protein
MAHNHKPRPSTTRIKSDGKKPVKETLKPIKIDDTRKLPKQYIVIGENWNDQKIENWDRKLRLRGAHIKRPLKLYELTRIVKTVELCLEVEDALPFVQ